MFMIDVETLGTDHGKVIVQIGWAHARNVWGGIETGGVNVDPDSCIKEGGKMDVDTVEWWILHGGAEAYGSTMPNRVGIQSALLRLQGAILKFSPKTIWVSAPTFDFTGLKFYYDALGMSMPWSFRQERCFRTFREEIPGALDRQPSDAGLAHNAKDDAEFQLEWLLNIKREM